MNPEEKTEIVICLGSSCFARGNKQNVKIIQNFIKEKGIEHKVSFRGRHCFGNCDNGPSLTIGEKQIDHLNSDNLLEILNEFLPK